MNKTITSEKVEKKYHKHFFHSKETDQRIRFFFAMYPESKVSYQKLLQQAIDHYLDHKGVPQEFPQSINN